MNRFVCILLSITFVLAIAVSGFAQQTPSADNRERRQQRRINRGVKSGTLTKREAARMEHQQARTKRMEAKAKSDGVVTRRERARLQHRENRTSRHIYRQKHDRQNRNSSQKKMLKRGRWFPLHNRLPPPHSPGQLFSYSAPPPDTTPDSFAPTARPTSASSSSLLKLPF